MELFHMRVMQRQVLDQCKYLIKAAERINTGLAANDLDEVFFSIQNLLNAGANISKMLWGQLGKRAKEREALRASVNVADDSALREVTMRNNFEHMDERIDRWWVNSKQHVHVDRVVAPKGAVAIPDPTDLFREFDPTTTNVGFWGQEFNIQALVDAVQAILPALEAEAKKPHWIQ
ncbi:hypothetical protein QO002_002175 [Pararhizobium capsulatum DSM 1112]|uniref:Uncharacterized protein n=1 Tax=Pararhizobium capsulatum DSM 1112 TaxID=1121113 RepID=A0ABU0BP55_9HYPH|nr:hypothetical protein [Pararhizobium capsulatum]MDQ0320037.1 hypothetical protein [Pararhizobium capsulatum DSM 1112]